MTMERSPRMPAGRLMFFPRAFYLFRFAAMACIGPFLTLYYEQIGLSGKQIGLLRGIPSLVVLFSAPLWGAVADNTQHRKRLLLVALASVVASVFLLSLAKSFALLIPIVVAYAFFGAPIAPLVDSNVVELLGARKDEYGRQRLWGAVGWGVGAPLVGLLTERNGLQWAFYCYFVLMLGNLIVSTQLPISRSPARRQFWRNLGGLVTDRRWILFLVTVFVGGISLTFVMSFLFLYMDDLGASKTLMGLALTAATASEVPFWFFSNCLLRRWGSRGMLVVAMLTCAAMALAFSLIRVPWLALPVQLLQGPAFAALWTAGVSYAAEIAPPGTKTTAQALFSGVAMGLRSAVGAFVGGLLYDSVGPATMFLLGGVAALAALLLFVLAGGGRKVTANLR